MKSESEKEKQRAYKRQWVAANRDKVNAKSNRWYAENRYKVTLRNEQRRKEKGEAKKRDETPLSPAEIHKRNEMVMAVYPLIRKLVNEFCQRRGCQYLFEDLLQRSQIVVMAAAPKFNPSMGMWTTFAGKSVTLHLQTQLRKDRKHNHASMTHPDGSKVDIADPDAANRLRDVLATEETALLLSRLDPQQRQVIRWSFWEGISHPIIALRLDLTVSRVEQIVAAAMATMRASQAPKPIEIVNPTWWQHVKPKTLTETELAVWQAFQFDRSLRSIAAKLQLTQKQVDNALQRVRRKSSRFLKDDTTAI